MHRARNLMRFRPKSARTVCCIRCNKQRRASEVRGSSAQHRPGAPARFYLGEFRNGYSLEDTTISLLYFSGPGHI
jgi:hypothetical protein